MSGYQKFGGDTSGGNFDVSLDDTKALFTPFTDACVKLEKQGGLEALADALHTNLEEGIPDSEKSDHFASRKKAFGDNSLPDPDPPNFFALWWDAYKDEMLIILTVAAVVSLVLGVFFPQEGSAPSLEGGIEGFAILLAVIVVTTVSAATNYSQEKQFQQTNKQNDDVSIKVRRGGRNTQCQIADLLAGDIVILSSGDKVPADGYLIEYHNLSVDETILSGESDAVRKNKENGYLLRGTDIQDGNCRFMVVNVGINTEWGSNFTETEFEDTPLQEKLGVVARNIGFLGLAVAALVFFVLCGYWVYDQVTSDEDWDWNNLTDILQYFITAVTIVVVAVPEGLPLAVTVALAFSMKKMMHDNNFVRHLAACETMGGATQICSDKTGTLTLGQMNVTQGTVAGKDFEDPEIRDMNDEVHHLLTEGIALNSTSYVEQPSSSSEKIKYVGSPTECALLIWINKLNVNYDEIRKGGPKVVQQFPFSSARKRMSAVIELSDGGYRMYTKGASEIILRRSTKMMKEDGSVEELDDSTKDEYLQAIEKMASNGLRTLCMAYRDFEVFDVNEDYDDKDDEPPEMKLTLLAVVGIADPVRQEVPDSVRTCQKAGITVRMVTGDNILTAKYIAGQCGILKDNGVALEGPEFAAKSDAEIDELLPRLQVLARSAPTDKERLVNRLKIHDELVSVTGDGANDVKALKKAHVGLAMGGGSDVAKQASDIVILDDNFTSILKSVMWGRCVFDNIRKFLQFQLTVNVAALAVAAFAALAGQEPLTAVQLLWVNLIMDSFGALALATEPPTEALLDRPPKNVAHPKTSLLSPEMWKMILGQAIYQTIVLLGGLLCLPKLDDWFGWDTGLGDNEAAVHTIIFNAFIFCQLFNLVACRKINPGEYNVFAGLHKNIVFLIILIGETLVQVMLVGITWTGHTDSDGNPERLAGVALDWIGVIFDTVPLPWQGWLFCIGIGLVGFVWGMILRFIPMPKEKIYKGTHGADEDDEKSHLLQNEH